MEKSPTWRIMSNGRYFQGQLYSVVALTSTDYYQFIGYKELRATGTCPRLQLEWKKKMYLQLICFQKQHLFQGGSPLEGVPLTREEHVGVRLRGQWEAIQESGIVDQGFFRLLHVTLQFLEEKRWSPNISSSFRGKNPPLPLPPPTSERLSALTLSARLWTVYLKRTEKAKRCLHDAHHWCCSEICRFGEKTDHWPIGLGLLVFRNWRSPGWVLCVTSLIVEHFRNLL